MAAVSDWLIRDAASLWHPYSPLLGEQPPLIVRAEAENLYLEDGRTLIDLISSWWVNIHGHGRKELAEALANQCLTLDHVIFASFSHQPGIELAERLLQRLPKNQEKIFYSDNGSTAVEVALKLAFQAWKHRGEKKEKVIVLEGSYHGDTVGTMSVSERGIFTEPFRQLLFDVISVPRPTCGDERFIEELENAFALNSIAAFIYEPRMQGASGMNPVDDVQLSAGIRLAKERGVITIADEVMTGFGRTGSWFVSSVLDPAPDMICLSKGITGGVMPFAATSVSAALAREFESSERSRMFFHGHSYAGNPLACSVALASLSLLESHETWEKIRQISESHARAAQYLAGVSGLSNVRHCGTIFACDIHVSDTGYLSAIRNDLYRFFIDRGLLLRPLGNVMYLMPPYCISQENLARAYEAIKIAGETFGRP